MIKPSVILGVVLAAAITSPGVLAEQTKSGTTVTVVFEGLPSDQGALFAGLCLEAEYETFDCRNALLEPDPAGVRYVWTNIPAGQYGVTSLHDENSNGKMDFSFFGAPKEKWGSSNNPPPRMGRSLWKDIAFEVSAEPVSLTIEMR